jgi:diguanylate cyclase (GGDEF)-like protein
VRERLLHTHISHLARHDALTGLPNRALLHERIAAAIETATHDGHRLAVVFLDLDRFKDVNDSLGHGVGDWLLESVAGRLTACVSDRDTVSRQGGDEFLILLSHVRGGDEAAAAVARMLGAIGGVHRFGPHELHVTASAGIALYPDAGADSETLIKNADVAMFHAKAGGPGSVQLFSDEMNARVVERHALESSLRVALDRGEFVLHYQPKIDLVTGATIGAEALLRWRHPERGLMPPERFVPLAEASGLIVPIGRWVMREACRQAGEWQAAGLRPVPVAVNVCALELRNSGFLDGVRRIIGDARIDPRLLELELTETALMDGAGATAAVLRELKAMGLGLAVDDFGTGYSSLSYLTQFPIDALKVDQSFVRDIGLEGEGSPIISAVISMGRSLKHRVIAEGVETPQQLAFLEEQRCEEAQGFHFSRPLEADRFAELLVTVAKSG